MAELAFKEQGAESILVEGIDDARISMAGRHLISRHRQGRDVDINAFDVPHAALVSVSEQLEKLGVTHELSEPLVDALRRYIISRGGEFSRTTSAKPVRIHMSVSDGLPERRFENGMTEIACIGAEAVKVQGVAGQNVRTTISGTATTSNAADVDAMFANIRGLRLWLRFEAPTKEDLDGLMSAMENTLAGVAQAVGGTMSAEDFKNLLDALESEAALTPQMEELIESLIALQKADELGLGKDQIGELIQNISTLIAEGQERGLIPAAFIEAASKALRELSTNEVMREFLVENGFDDLVASNDNAVSIEERIAELMEQLETLQSLEGVSETLSAELQEMIEGLKQQLAQENVDPASILAALSEKLIEIASNEDIPQAVFDGIGEMLPEIAALKQKIVEAGISAPDLSNPEAMLVMLEDIAAKIQAGDLDTNEVPPELMEVIEHLGGVEALIQEQGREARLEAVSAAIEDPATSDIGVSMAAVIEIISDPVAAEQLPPALIESVQAFMEASFPEMEASTIVVADNVDAPEIVLESSAGLDMLEVGTITGDRSHPSVDSATSVIITSEAAPSAPVVALPTSSTHAEHHMIAVSNPVPPLPSQLETTETVAPEKKAEVIKNNDAETREGTVTNTDKPEKAPSTNPTHPEQSPVHIGVDVKSDPQPDSVPDCCKDKFKEAASGLGANAPDVVITPEVKELVKTISQDKLEKFGGEQIVEKTLQEFLNKDENLLKDKTPEQILVQAEALKNLNELIPPDKDNTTLDNANADERKRQELIRLKRNDGFKPIFPKQPDVKEEFGHVCGAGCAHGKNVGSEKKATLNEEQASVFEGSASPRRRRGSSLQNNLS